jgi:hypothetical protein
MTKFANRSPVRGAASMVSLAVCLALAVAASGEAFADSAAQAPSVPPPQSAPAASGAAPAAAGAPAASSPTTPQQESPAFRPGFLHQLKTWWDDSLAVFDRKDASARGTATDASKKPEDNSPGVADRAKDAAANAVTTTQDAMKNAVEATKGAASSAVEATKNAASAIARLPNTRVIQVSEICVRAPNGGSDCASAAANGCRAKGFAGGTPLDVRTSSRCDPNPPQAGQMPTVQCSPESVVTRAICQ